MPPIRLIIGLVVVAALAFWIPALLHKPAPRLQAHDWADPIADSAATTKTSAPGAVSAGTEAHTLIPVGGAAPPVVLPGFTGAAKVAGQALLDKMMGKHNEMTRWAEGERTRIEEMEPRLQEQERQIKDTDARLEAMVQQLDRMRADSRSNRAEYDALQNTHNDLVVERNGMVQRYDQQFADYNAAIHNFDAKIADYEARLHKALPVP